MPRSEPPRELGAILDAAEAFLKGRGAQEPRLAAEWLAARLLNCGRLDLRMRYDRELSQPHIEAMRRGVRRVAAGEPVQYVAGRWEFRGHPLKVDKRALIPRPETEVLVQRALDEKYLWQNPEPRIADIGTGSGCIAISLAIERPQGRYLAIDICPDALELARENAKLNGVEDRVHFALGELSDILDSPGSLDAIVSNPPYIPAAVVEKLAPSVREFEPRIALDGGEDGLDIVRRIVEDATFALRNGGHLFMELSSEQRQAETVSQYLHELGFEGVRISRDNAGAERIIDAVLALGV